MPYRGPQVVRQEFRAGQCGEIAITVEEGSNATFVYSRDSDPVAVHVFISRLARRCEKARPELLAVGLTSAARRAGISPETLLQRLCAIGCVVPKDEPIRALYDGMRFRGLCSDQVLGMLSSSAS